MSMKLPSINIIFKAAAAETVQRLRKGVAAIIVKDAKNNGGHVLASERQIPAELGEANKDYVKQAFVGYETRPRKVLLYVLPVDAASFETALEWLGSQSFDYLAGPPSMTQDEAKEIADWVKEVRESGGSIAKAVLPNYAGDHEGIVNFAASGIKVGEKTYTAAGYCARIAGLLVGTPMTMSCTYAPLPEVTDVTRMTPEDADTAVEAGKLILIHDEAKVKIGLGVNSLQTLRKDQNATLKKIKIVEVRDLIQANLRRACQDSWIGRHSASYDDKCLLISAVRDYLVELENEGILQPGSTVGMDVEAIREYLEAKEVDTSGMDEQELKEADTDDTVFLAVDIKILDAIEHIQITVHH